MDQAYTSAAGTAHKYTGSRKFFTLFLLLQSSVFIYFSYSHNALVFPLAAVIVMGFTLLTPLIFPPQRLYEGPWYPVILLFFTTGIIAFAPPNPGMYLYYGMAALTLAVFLNRWLVFFYLSGAAFIMLYAWIDSSVSHLFYAIGDTDGSETARLGASVLNFSLGAVFSFLVAHLVVKWYGLTMKVEEVEESEQASEFLESHEIPYLMYLKPVADNIRRLAEHIEKTGNNNMIRLTGQKEKISEVNKIVRHLGDAFHETSGILDAVKNITTQCREITRKSSHEIHVILEMVKQMVKIVESTRKHVKELKESTKKVENVINVIDKISNQTRLLALNASIEAARFGAGQRGFVMVADEVKVLSVLTQLSVQDITNTVRDIKVKTKSVEEIIEQEMGESIKGLDIARLGEQSVKYVDSILDSVEMETDLMKEEFEANRESAINIVKQFNNILTFVEENSMRMDELLVRIDDLKLQSENVMTIVQSCDLDNTIHKQNDKAFMYGNRVIMECDAIFENGLRIKEISMDDLFSREYEPFEDYPDLFHSKYDRFIEKSLQKVIDEFLEKEDNFVYIYLMDSKGYIPVHNKIYSQELTGNQAIDEKLHRSKRIYQDYATSQALKHDDIYLLQCIRHSSDTEPVMDLSVPFYFRDRLWGIVRVGFVYI